MDILNILSAKTIEALKHLYGVDIENVAFEATNPTFEGDFTFVVFPYLRMSKKKPEITAEEIGAYLVENVAEINRFNVVKGFLNIVIDDDFWKNYFESINGKSLITSVVNDNSPKVLVEYSSPNTNKPLHLGHVRNNLLGFAVAEILKAAGNKVEKVNLVNDRGIHICKSMIAWQKWGEGETPESSGLKGDHLVGKYYVVFDKQYKDEIKKLVEGGMDKKEAEKEAPLMKETQDMLLKWEAGDDEVRALWTKMNTWVYDGFGKTYKTMGVDFDKTYYESNTYLLGKDIIEEGLSKGVLQRREDNSIFIDLTPEGLDEKTLLRGDGTSVYMTQDLGTAIQRYQEYTFDKSIYTVGNEQDYHFKVLFLVLEKLGYEWAKGLYHLSYGMVELPEGKMKSREGTVVDADDLMAEMVATAKATTEELGKTEGLTEKEVEELHKTVGMGALKYFMLKIDPKKKMMFNPKESIDFNGNTAPFIQFNYVRIQALLRTALEKQIALTANVNAIELLPKEKNLIVKLYNFNAVLQQAAKEYSPALIANYTYELAKEYSQYYHDVNVFQESDNNLISYRLQLANTIAITIKNSLGLLGISVPERM